MSRGLWVVTVAALLASASPPVAAATNGTLVLSVEHCLELALGGDREIRLGSLVVRERAEDIVIVGRTFTPSAYVDATRGDAESPTSTTLGGADVLIEELVEAEGGVRKKWTLGTQTDLTWFYTRRDSNSEFSRLNPSHESELRLELTQPLLNGFGLRVNRAELNRALNDRQLADAEFNMLVEGELLGVFRAYWDLVLAMGAVDATAARLVVEAERAAEIRDRLAVGRATPLEALGVEAELERRREASAGARRRYDNATDRLLHRIRPGAEAAAGELRIIPSSRPWRDEPLDIPAVATALETAAANRPELRAAELRVANAGLDALVARNQRRPALDLTAAYGVQGLGGDLGASVDEATSGDFSAWSVGLSLEFLFSGASRAARLRQALVARDSADLRLAKLRADIALQVRAAVREAEVAGARLAAARVAADLADERLGLAVERRAAGLATELLVAERRADAVAARQDAATAAVGVLVARAALDAAQGVFAANLLADVQP